MSYRPGKEIIRAKLENATVGEIADCLGVDSTHIYNVERRGISPTLHTAMVEAGWVDPLPKVHVVAFHLHDADEAAALRALLARHGSRRRIARALVAGTLKIVEGECDE